MFQLKMLASVDKEGNTRNTVKLSDILKAKLLLTGISKCKFSSVSMSFVNYCYKNGLRMYDSGSIFVFLLLLKNLAHLSK
jgi:hypothetical protein